MPFLRRNNFLPAAILLFVIWGGPAPAATAPKMVFELRNGDRLTGVIDSEDTNRVVIGTAWGKNLDVPVSEIIRRATLLAGASQVTNAPPGMVPPPTALALAPPAPVQPKPPIGWQSEAQVGLDLSYSERTRQVFTGRVKVVYARDRLRNLLDYNFAYGRTDGVVDANRMEGSMKTDFDLGRRPYVYSLGSAGYDEVRKIDHRFEVGPGVGLHVVRLGDFILNTELGFNYQAEARSDHTRTEHIFYRLAENSFWKISSRLALDQKFEYLPQADHLGEFRLRFESNLRYWLLQNLYFNLTVSDQYDTMPANSVTQNDLQIRSSIGVRF